MATCLSVPHSGLRLGHNHFTWSLVLRDRTVYVDFGNGLGTISKLRWSAKPYLTAAGWREEIAIEKVSGAAVPAEVMEKIYAEVVAVFEPRPRTVTK